MAGNLGEMMADWGSNSYYATSPLDDPPGPEVGTLRIVRGGSWMLRGAPAFMCATRYAIAPEAAAADVGFRPVATSAQMGDLSG